MKNQRAVMKKALSFYKKIIPVPVSLCLSAAILLSDSFAVPALADKTNPDYRRALTVESNEIEGWPAGPVTGAQSAIVIDASTNVILYEKNIHERLYPASTTKLMTALVAIENSSLTDEVTVSQRALSLVPSDGSRIGLSVGDTLTMEEMLYGVMVGSGNEAANAVAEHVGGSIENFVEMMNEKAAELGLEDTHFVNPSGLHDDDHYTSAYDLALIAIAYFDNVTLSEIGGTVSHTFKFSDSEDDTATITNRHELVTGETALDGVIGGKTGFTDEAGSCLVTCAEQNGLKLVCVVMFEDSPEQFNDSATLLEYGFDYFERVSMTAYESEVLPARPSFFLPEKNLFERTVTSYSFETGSALTLPIGSDVADTEFEIINAGEALLEENDVPAEDTVIAQASYTFNGAYVGAVNIVRKTVTPTGVSERQVIYINLFDVLLRELLVTCGVLAPILIVRALIKYFKSDAYRRKKRRERRRH